MTQDPVVFRMLDLVGDCLMFGSDFPHTEGTWPNSQETLDGLLAGVPDPLAHAIVFGHAAEVYRFRVPAATAAGTGVG